MRHKHHRRTTTTEEQRHSLFTIWEQTGNVKEACNHVQVSRGTFYYWKERFENEGYRGLVKLRSRAPINPRTKDEETTAHIIQLKRENPTWGKLRIAQEMLNQGLAETLSPNTVRRILIDADLWEVS